MTLFREEATSVIAPSSRSVSQGAARGKQRTEK